MMDEDFLKRKEIVWYKRILIGSVGIALALVVGSIIMFIL